VIEQRIQCATTNASSGTMQPRSVFNWQLTSVTVNIASCNLSSLARSLVTHCPTLSPLFTAKQQLQQQASRDTSMTTEAQVRRWLGSSDNRAKMKK